MKQEAGKTRDLSLDIIRIVATLAVVMIHCASPFGAGIKRAHPSFGLATFWMGFPVWGYPCL